MALAFLQSGKQAEHGKIKDKLQVGPKIVILEDIMQQLISKFDTIEQQWVA